MSQKMSVYAHQDLILQDPIFAIGYSAALTVDPEDCFFPDYAQHCHLEDDKLMAKTAQLFKQYYKVMMTLCELYGE